MNFRLSTFDQLRSRRRRSLALPRIQRAAEQPEHHFLRAVRPIVQLEASALKILDVMALPGFG